MQGHRPPRPTHSACSDRLWALMQQCWDQEPLLRPKVSEVFQVLPCSNIDRLQHLYVPGMASHEFQLALGRFYGSTEYQDCINNLHGPDLKHFVDFLDTVNNLFRPNTCSDSGLGAADKGIKSKFTPTNVAQPTENLRSSGHNPRFPCNL